MREPTDGPRFARDVAGLQSLSHEILFVQKSLAARIDIIINPRPNPTEQLY